MVYGREFVCVARDASELWELNMRLGAQANHQIMWSSWSLFLSRCKAQHWHYQIRAPTTYRCNNKQNAYNMSPPALQWQLNKHPRSILVMILPTSPWSIAFHIWKQMSCPLEKMVYPYPTNGLKKVIFWDTNIRLVELVIIGYLKEALKWLQASCFVKTNSNSKHNFLIYEAGV